jgi:hypothetical protein
MITTKLRRHAKKRMKERVGIALTKKLELQIIGIIKSGKAEDVGCSTANHRDSKYRRIYNVDICNRIIRLVYSHSSEQLVTVLRGHLKSEHDGEA